MDTLVIGDLHGRYEIVEKAIASGYPCIFIGDYLDSFDRSIEDQIGTLKLVLDKVDEDPDKYVALLGNHELSYLDDTMKASGYNRSTHYHLIHGLQERMLKLKSYHHSHGYLLSHAGVSQRLLKAKGMSLEDYLAIGNFKEIGYRRGGLSPIGGLYWCDWFAEFEPILDQPQIVGHSGYRPQKSEGVVGILKNGNSFNVDCFEYTEEFLLLPDDGPARIIKLT